MRTEDMIIVSVDDHVVEPPDLFERHLPAKYRDLAPKVIHKDDGTDVWQFLEFEVPNIGLNAVAGRPPEEYGIHRVAKKGCHAVTFPENPEPLGLPSLHSDHWDPFWAACSDEGTTVCMHIG